MATKTKSKSKGTTRAKTRAPKAKKASAATGTRKVTEIDVPIKKGRKISAKVQFWPVGDKYSGGYGLGGSSFQSLDEGKKGKLYDTAQAVVIDKLERIVTVLKKERKENYSDVENGQIDGAIADVEHFLEVRKADAARVNGHSNGSGLKQLPLKTSDDIVLELKYLQTFCNELDTAYEFEEKARLEWLDAQQVAKDKKESYETAVAHTRKLIAAKHNDENRPLLKDRPAPTESLEQGFLEAKAKRQEKAAAGPVTGADLFPSDEAWRRVTLSDLGILPKLQEKLIAHDPPLGTQGALADFVRAGGDLKKVVNAASILKIDEALLKFWAEHPLLLPPFVKAAPAGTTGTTTPAGIEALGQADANSEPPAANPDVLKLPERKDATSDAPTAG